MRAAIAGGWFWVPNEAVEDMPSLVKMLQFKPRFRDKKEPPVSLFMERPGYLGVPLWFGMQRFPWLEIDDRRTAGEAMQPVARLPDPNHPSVREPERQAQFMTDMEVAIRQQQNFIASAPTGAGKTVVALRAAAMHGRRTLVMVHTEQLMEQWVKAARDHLGLAADRVGIVKGNKCQWDSDIMVGMLQSNAFAPHRYPKEFYQSIGMIIWDEVHKLGAPVFSQAAWQFPAAVRFGLSATARRKDGGEVVFFYHLGPVSVQSEQEAMPCQVHVIPHYGGAWMNKVKDHGARAKCIGKSHDRNMRLVNIIKKMHAAGRQALIVGDAIWHLQHLMELCEASGIPRDDMGQFTARMERIITENVGGVVRQFKKAHNTPKGMLEKVKRESQLIFATYSMIKEGVDIPRLDAGLDVTPRGDAEQLIGRIRRMLEGKKPAIWTTILDVQVGWALGYYEGRLREYAGSGCEVIVHER